MKNVYEEKWSVATNLWPFQLVHCEMWCVQRFSWKFSVFTHHMRDRVTPESEDKTFYDICDRFVLLVTHATTREWMDRLVCCAHSHSLPPYMNVRIVVSSPGPVPKYNGSDRSRSTDTLSTNTSVSGPLMITDGGVALACASCRCSLVWAS